MYIAFTNCLLSKELHFLAFKQIIIVLLSITTIVKTESSAVLKFTATTNYWTTTYMNKVIQSI